MSIWNRRMFPGTNLQDLNLDWILRKISALRGGVTGQVLSKKSNKDFDFEWKAGGGGGATFFPTVSQEGVISWTNDGGYPNPDPVNIKGADGTDGVGVPTGGVAGDTLLKVSAADYYTRWGRPPIRSDNMFHNWYFGPGWPINQRGKSSYNKDEVTVDRWKLNKEDETGESYVSVTDGYLRFHAEGSTGDSLSQVIYNSGLSVGDYVTCTVYQADGTYLTTSLPVTQSLSSRSYTGGLGWSCGVEIVGGQVVVHPLMIDLIDRDINIVAVKLEPGSEEQTLVRSGELLSMPDYAAELNHCLSFYRKIVETCCPGVWRGNNTLRFSLPAPASCGTYTAELDRNDTNKAFYLAQDTGMSANLTPSFTVLGTASGRLYISATVSETGLSYAPFSSITVVPLALIIENGM